MWSDDNLMLEDLIRAAEPTPRLTNTFRHQVIAQAVRARRRNESMQRVQTLTTLLLVVAAFVFVPGYYQSAQHGGLPTAYRAPAAMADYAVDYSYFSRTALAAMAVAQPMTSTDAFEWSLIEAEFAVKDHSMRAFGGAL